MNRKLKATLLLAILTLSYAAILPATAHTEDDPYVTDLVAGQNMDAGDVLVWNDGDYLYVKYVADEGWMISETHLHVATALEDIPQKNGNPIPGQFENKTEHDPWVGEYTYQRKLVWDTGEELYIAAHAVVKDLVNVDEYCIDFEDEMYNEFDPVTMVSTDFGPVNFYMTDWDELDGITVGDTAELESTGEHPIIAEPQNYDVEAPAYNIAGFTVNVGGLVDDWVKADPDNTGAGGKTLTDPLDETQSELLKHAYSRHQAIVVDLSEIEDMLSLSLAGIDPDHGETWYAYYFDADNELIHINTYQGETQAKDGYAIPLTYDDMNIAKIAFYGLNNLAIEGRVGYAIDNICFETSGEETAWGAPHGFPGKNWALYLKYTVQETIVIQEFPPGGGNAYIGYEDRTGGDFDYNDFGMNMYVLETYVDGCLQTIELEFTSLVKKAGDVHDIHLTRFFSADTEYDYTITRSVPAAGTETPAGAYSGSDDLDIILFDSSKGVGKTVSITITVTACDDYYNPSPVAPRWDVDPFFENYDPWMVDKTTSNSWQITSVQPATSTLPTQGYDVPYILIVPYTDWPAPNEAVTITGPYPYFDEWYSTMDPTYEEWYVPGFSP